MVSGDEHREGVGVKDLVVAGGISEGEEGEVGGVRKLLKLREGQLKVAR